MLRCEDLRQTYSFEPFCRKSFYFALQVKDRVKLYPDIVSLLSRRKTEDGAMTRPTPEVRIVEVGPRDGLQNIQEPIPTETKIELIQRLRRAGLRSIELTSIVSPRKVPQLADCEQVLSNATIKDLIADSAKSGLCLRFPVLTPNLKGLNVAMAHGVKEVAVFVSATEGFSQANINCSVEKGLEMARTVVQKAVKANIAVRGYVQICSLFFFFFLSFFSFPCVKLEKGTSSLII